MLKRVVFVGVAVVPVAALGAATELLPVHAAGGSYVVTTSADAPFNEGDCTGSNTCTLRDAVMLSDAAGGTNTITFATTVTSPLAITDGPLPVTGQAVTITGNGTSSTVIDGAGNNNAGIFTVANNQCPTAHQPAGTRTACVAAQARAPRAVTTGGTLSLADLTVRNGANPAGGGAVAATSGADVNATDVVFSGNTSTDGFGGAISAAGNVDIGASTFSANAAADSGGAIDDVLDTGGALTITQSTFTANSASDGGAVWAGLQSFSSGSSTIDIENSTFTGNTASNDGGAIVDSIDTATLVNDTIVGNTATGQNPGGGVSASSNSDVGTGHITYSDDLVGSNTPADCDYPTDSPATVIAADHSIDTGTSCAFGSGNGNVQGADAAALKLDSQPRDNGGPTQTIALLPGSSALDAGSNASCASTDQRGVPRPQHGTCDVGAFEADVTTTTVDASQSAPGADVIVTATITGSSPDAGVPQGTVSFTKNGTSLGSAQTNGDGVATIDMPVTSPDDPVFAATYTPANGFFGSTGSTSFTPAVASIPVPATGAGGGTPAGGALLLLGGLGLVGAGRRRR